jgi:CBS domain-containing protein
VLRHKDEHLWAIAPDATVHAAVGTMARMGIGALVVLDSGALVGIVSERDCVRKVLLEGRSARQTLVADIMVSGVVTVGPDSSLQDCMQLMTERRIRHLPVVEGGRVTGMISIGDAVRETLLQQRDALHELQRYVTGEPRLQEPDWAAQSIR